MLRNRLFRLLNWRLATLVGIELYLIFSLAYFFWGQPNADEGWYMYASRLVLEGKIPYRDFAFTQTPFLPYVYALPQVIILPSIYLGRATSILLAFASLLMCVFLARRYAGERGAGLVALLLGTFTYGIYYESIIKTYALLSLLFALTFFILSSNIQDGWKFPLAVVSAFFAAMTRLSAVFFLIPVVIYCLMATLRKPVTFACVVLSCAALVSGAFFLFSLDWPAAMWGLMTYHLGQWGSASGVDGIVQIIFGRIPSLMRYFDLYFFLTLPLMFLAVFDHETRHRTICYLRHNTSILVTGCGLILFAISHLGTGSWHAEYFVPAIVAFSPITAIAYDKIYTIQKDWSSKLLLSGILTAILLIAPIHNEEQFIDVSSGEPPLEKIREVSLYISNHSSPSDRIFALEALWVAVDSNRDVLPGMTMAQFSYQDIATEDAGKLRLVNSDIALEYVKNCAAKVVVLTDLDWLILKQHENYSELISQALSDRYELALTKGAFGQTGMNVYVYFCHTDQQ